MTFSMKRALSTGFAIVLALKLTACAQAPRRPTPSEPPPPQPAAAAPAPQQSTVPEQVADKPVSTEPAPQQSVSPTQAPQQPDPSAQAPQQPVSSTQAQPTPQAPEQPKPATPSKPAPEDKSGFKVGGSVYLAFENWSRVGTSGDSKIGFGFGGGLGLGYQFDDMRFLIGPHLSLNRWSADYSQKSQSATDSVYVEMADAGFALTMNFDGLYIEAETGNSTISSGMIVKGRDYKYTYDGKKFSYHSVGIGALLDHFLFGLNAVSYSDFAKYANRIEIRLGLGF